MTIVQDHAAVYLGLLDADNTPPALVPYDGVVPTGAVPPYVLVYVAVTTLTAEQAPDSGDITAACDRLSVTAYCHSVGTTAPAARAVAARVRAALLGIVPTIAGRACWPIRQIDGLPPARDEAAGRVVMDQVDVYRFDSVPA